jgi:flagellar basal-body rod protein FlgG
VTSDGSFLQPPITLPPNFTTVTISPDGTISASTNNGQTFQKGGQITLVQFANPPGLISVGTNFFTVSPASGSPVTTIAGQGGTGPLVQGLLEGSNVNPTTELSNLLIAQQTFSANSQTINTANDMLITTAELVALT